MHSPKFLAVAAFAACLSVGTISCSSSLEGICVEATSVIASAGAYVDEAQKAVDRAYDIASALPHGARDEALKAVSIADATLFAVTQAASAASLQCAKLDIPTLFRDFANAWDGVKDKLDVHGGSETPVLIDPKAYSLGKSAK